MKVLNEDLTEAPVAYVSPEDPIEVSRRKRAKAESEEFLIRELAAELAGGDSHHAWQGAIELVTRGGQRFRAGGQLLLQALANGCKPTDPKLRLLYDAKLARR